MEETRTKKFRSETEKFPFYVYVIDRTFLRARADFAPFAIAHKLIIRSSVDLRDIPRNSSFMIYSIVDTLVKYRYFQGVLIKISSHLSSHSYNYSNTHTFPIRSFLSKGVCTPRISH